MMHEEIKTTGTYKLQTGDYINKWTYFIYRRRNGILEDKMRDNKFSEWQVVDGLPEGAVIV